MIPVVQKEHTQVLIVIGRSRAIDHDSTKDTLPRLQSKVGMIPSRAILRCLPSVRYSIFRGCGTLSDRDDTILIVGIVLTNAVPVNTSAILRVDQVVRNMNSDCITPVREDCWSRNSAVLLSARLKNTVYVYPPIDRHR